MLLPSQESLEIMSPAVCCLVCSEGGKFLADVMTREVIYMLLLVTSLGSLAFASCAVVGTSATMTEPSRQ